MNLVLSLFLEWNYVDFSTGLFPYFGLNKPELLETVYTESANNSVLLYSQ